MLLINGFKKREVLSDSKTGLKSFTAPKLTSESRGDEGDNQSCWSEFKLARNLFLTKFSLYFSIRCAFNFVFDSCAALKTPKYGCWSESEYHLTVCGALIRFILELQLERKNELISVRYYHPIKLCFDWLIANFAMPNMEKVCHCHCHFAHNLGGWLVSHKITSSIDNQNIWGGKRLPRACVRVWDFNFGKMKGEKTYSSLFEN